MLTDEEIGAISCMNLGVYDYARAIERALLAKAMPIPKQEPYAFEFYYECDGGWTPKILKANDFGLDKTVYDFDFKNIRPLYTDPQPAQAPAIPEPMESGELTSDERASGYRNGWNDCREAMLSASPKPE